MKVASCGVGGLMKLVWFGSWFGRRNLRFRREVCPFILITYDRPLARLSKVTACWSHRLVSTCCAMICCPGFNCAQWRDDLLAWDRNFPAFFLLLASCRELGDCLHQFEILSRSFCAYIISSELDYWFKLVFLLGQRDAPLRASLKYQSDAVKYSHLSNKWAASLIDFSFFAPPARWYILTSK